MAEEINEETSESEEITQSEESTATEDDSTVTEDALIQDEETSTEVEEESETTEETQDEESDPEVIEDEENPVQKKQTKIQKILMIVAGVLGGILVLGIILYFFGVFDPEEPPKPVVTDQTMDMNQTKEPEKYVFDEKDINVDRLNGKLRILTKYEIIGTQEEERQKELEKNSKLSTAQINDLLKAEQEKEEKEKLDAIKKAEEDKKKVLEDKKKQEELKKAEEAKKKQEAQEKENKERRKTERPYDLLKFIQVAIEKENLAPINDDLNKFKVKISQCSDNNQNFLLIGPFNSNKELNQAFRLIYKDITQNTTKKDLARLEFNRICK